MHLFELVQEASLLLFKGLITFGKLICMASSEVSDFLAVALLLSCELISVPLVKSSELISLLAQGIVLARLELGDSRVKLALLLHKLVSELSNFLILAVDDCSVAGLLVAHLLKVLLLGLGCLSL